MRISSSTMPPRMKAGLNSGREVINSRKTNTSPERYLPSTSERALSRVTLSRSKVWRSRSRAMAPEVSAGAVKLTITSSIHTTRPKTSLP